MRPFIVLLTVVVLPPNASAQDSALTLAVTVPLPQHEAFALWTTEQGLERFVADQVVVEPWVGGRYEIAFEPEVDPAGARAGTYGSRVLEVAPPHRLVFE